MRNTPEGIVNTTAHLESFQTTKGLDYGIEWEWRKLASVFAF